MISRILGDRRSRALTRRIDRPEALAIALAQAIVAVIGWLVEEPVWLAAAIAGQLAIGGLAGIRLIGPARADLGFARYAMPASAGVATTLFGRLLPGGLSLLLVPLVAVLLWSVIYLELRAERLPGGRTVQDVLMTAILFAGSSGILELFTGAVWPPPITLVAPLAAILALRGAEGRGASGAEALGLALLHVLAVMQVGVAASLLALPPLVVPALMTLTFYAWGGAAEALRAGSTGRTVALEFGALGLLGLVLALVLHRG